MDAEAIGLTLISERSDSVPKPRGSGQTAPTRSPCPVTTASRARPSDVVVPSRQNWHGRGGRQRGSLGLRTRSAIRRPTWSETAARSRSRRSSLRPPPPTHPTLVGSASTWRRPTPRTTTPQAQQSARHAVAAQSVASRSWNRLLRRSGRPQPIDNLFRTLGYRELVTRSLTTLLLPPGCMVTP